MNTDSNSCGNAKNQMGVSEQDFIKKVRALQNRHSDGSIGEADAKKQMDGLKGAHSGLLERPAESLCRINELLKLSEEDEKKESLFEGHWFHRGKAVALVSMSGAGKSVLTMQLCCAWACGRAAFGLKPLHPLKIMLIQGEDNKFASKDLYSSVKKGFGIYETGLSTEEESEIEKNLLLYVESGKKDDGFFDFLIMEQVRNEFDLIVVNPLARVTSCSLSDGKEANKLADDFSGVINSSLWKRCGLLVVHHTTKAPQNRNQATSFSHGINAQYAMAGAQEFMGWFRAIFMIVPDQKRWDKSKLLLAKGDVQRVGWSNHCSSKGGCESEIFKDILKEPPKGDFKFWHEGEESKATAAAKGNEKEMSIEDLAEKVVAKMEAQKKYTTRELSDLAKCTISFKTQAPKVVDEIKNNLEKYGVSSERGSGNAKFFWLKGDDLR